MENIDQLLELLGEEEEFLLNHVCKTITKDQIHLPHPDFTDTFLQSNRNGQTIRSLTQIYNHGRLSGTGYLSILPVDQGIEHTAGSSFAPNTMYFDPENIVKLAIEAGCNAIASTMGGLALLSRKYAHKIPFIVKINHNEFLKNTTK
jgi:class I fructose-bisphosphate aldolase